MRIYTDTKTIIIYKSILKFSKKLPWSSILRISSTKQLIFIFGNSCCIFFFNSSQRERDLHHFCDTDMHRKLVFQPLQRQKVTPKRNSLAPCRQLYADEYSFVSQINLKMRRTAGNFLGFRCCTEVNNATQSS